MMLGLPAGAVVSSVAWQIHCWGSTQNTVWHLISPATPTVSKYLISASLLLSPSFSACLFLTSHHSSWSVFIEVHWDFKAMQSDVNFDTTELTHGYVWSLRIRKVLWHPSESEERWALPCSLSPWIHKSFWLTSSYTQLSHIIRGDWRTWPKNAL